MEYTPGIYEPEQLIFNRHFDISVESSQHKIWIANLADGKGITTKLDQNFMLDWSNIFNEPKTARMHMYPGAENKIPFSEKLERMQNWATAIKVYDSLMILTSTHLNKEEITDLISQPQLPRLDNIILDTGTIGLVNLLKAMGYLQYAEPPHVFKVSWEDFVSRIKSGEFIEIWKKLKGV